jgi:zinc transporter ZupT
MADSIEPRIIRNKAAVAGLYFGGISIAYVLISSGMEKLSLGVAGSILSFILWAAKFVGCILLMRFLMQKLVREWDGVTRKETFRFGMLTALFSATLFAAFTLVFYLYIQPEMFSSVIGALASSGVYTSDQMDMIARMEPWLPHIGCAGNFIWCCLYGIILSAILSRNIPADDPFAE